VVKKQLFADHRIPFSDLTLYRPYGSVLEYRTNIVEEEASLEGVACVKDDGWKEDVEE
jgi:hypothetical protein